MAGLGRIFDLIWVFMVNFKEEKKMKKMGLHELRTKFLEFFESKDHLI